MDAVGAHDQVELPPAPAREVDLHGVRRLGETDDGVAKDVLDAVAGGVQEDPVQIAAHDLDAAGVACLEEVGPHGDDPLARPIEPRGALHLDAGAAHPSQDPHALPHVDRRTSHVNLVAAPTGSRRAFHDGGQKAVLAQPVRQDGPRDARAGDENASILQSTSMQTLAHASPAPTTATSTTSPGAKSSQCCDSTLGAPALAVFPRSPRLCQCS